jgi:hypothetical protein
MLFYVSIGAKDPANVASVLAQILGGQSHPFPVFRGSFIALAGDEHGTAVEVYPLGQALTPGKQGAETATLADAERPSETHFAIGTDRSVDELLAIADREWWICSVCDRGGHFHVVELWIENRLMIEALTPEMQQEYLVFARSARAPEKYPVLMASHDLITRSRANAGVAQ